MQAKSDTLPLSPLLKIPRTATTTRNQHRLPSETQIASIDRSKPRFVACNLGCARQAAEDLKTPASHFINAVVKIEQDLAEIKRHIREGKNIEQMQRCLPEAEKRLVNTKKGRTEQQNAVWGKFYGVWGPGNVKIDKPIKKKAVVDRAQTDALRKQARQRLKLNKERQMKGIEKGNDEDGGGGEEG